MRFAEIGRERLGARGDRRALERAAGLVGDGELGDSASDRGVGAPSHGLRGRRIAAPGEHDAIGEGARRVGEFVGVGRAGDMNVVFVTDEREREERERGEDRWEAVEFHRRKDGWRLAARTLVRDSGSPPRGTDRA